MFYKNKALVIVGSSEALMLQLSEFTDYMRCVIIEKNVHILNDVPKNIDRIYYVDNILCLDEVYEKISSILQISNICAVYPANEWCVETCAAIRMKFNIEGIDDLTATLTRDKYLMKKHIAQHNIKTAAIENINSVDDIYKFTSYYGFPAIIKPRNGSATKNTFIIKNHYEISDIIKRINLDNKFVIESFINGQEYHCDSVIYDNRIVFHSIGKYVHNCIDTVEKQLMLASVLIPSSEINKECKYKKIIDLNEKVVSILKINNCVCHMEVFVTDDENVYFGEIASRIGGGAIAQTIQHAFGINLFSSFIKLSIDQFIISDWKTEKHIGFLMLPTKFGHISDISSEDEFQKLEGIVEVRITHKIGDSIQPYQNTATNTGYIIIEADSEQMLIERLEKTYKKFRLSVKKNRIKF